MSNIVMETPSDLKALAKDQNPIVGYYDPLNLAEAEFWDQSNSATVGFLRHAEMKHGRVGKQTPALDSCFLALRHCVI